MRPQPVPLSQLIDVVNERFGTDFNQADQLFFDQIVEAAMADDGLRQAAAVNPGDKFELVFKNLLERLFVERMDQNEEIFVRFMNDVPFQKIVTAWMASEAYRRLRTDARETVQGAGSIALPPRLRIVEARPEERYVTCVPLVPLKAAAGAFGDPAARRGRRLRMGRRRIAPSPAAGYVRRAGRRQVHGARHPDGAYCLFRAPVEGTRQGKTVLVQLRDATDPETGQRYTVKRYESEKATQDDVVAARAHHAEAAQSRVRADRVDRGRRRHG